MKKVVLDTNALISGLLWDGNEARLNNHTYSITASEFIKKNTEQN